MFAKILHGQYELKQMFWKYGVWFIFVICAVTYGIRLLLVHRLNGMKLSYYFTNVFSINNIDSMMIGFTMTYFIMLFILSFYNLIWIFGIWRSSAEYEKSAWLRQLTRLASLILIFISYKVLL